MSPDDGFDARLRQALLAKPEPADTGFSLRVMQALPAQARRRPDTLPLRALRLTALCVTQASLALLLAAGLPDAEALAGTTVLLLLLSWWSLPQGRSGLRF